MTDQSSEATAWPVDDLSAEQRAVVQHPPDGAHLLVLAAPGSGKTRVIAERIRWLVEACGVPPTAFVAMTFTRRAAEELRSRIGNGDVWAGTFHTICNRILHEHGAEVGLRPPFRIADEHDAVAALAVAARRAGVPLPEDPRQRGWVLKELRRRVSDRKRTGTDGAPANRRDRLPEPLVLLVADAYRKVLAERNALDYDDLVVRAVEVLATAPEVAASLGARYRYLFVDEFHDVSREQYELIRRLAPPRRLDGQVAVVADPQQAIYGWRGGDLRLLDEYRRGYRPIRRHLTANYRSTPQIVAAARAVMERHADIGPLATPNPPGHPVACLGIADRDAEAATLVRLVKKARAAGYGYGQMAVLLRTHERGHAAERELLKAGVPLWRVQPDRFFANEQVKEVLRYLELGLALHDDLFAAALNWPRVAVDELAMIDLRRLAEERGCSLCEVARGIDDHADRISPLARAAVRDLLRLIDEALLPVIDRPFDAVIESLMPALAARRGPIPRAEREALFGTWEFLAAPLGDAARRLESILVAGQPLALRHDGSADAAAGAVILRSLARDYLGRPAEIVGPGMPVPAGAFTIELGGEALNAPEDASRLRLGQRRTRGYAYSVSTIAWRLAQLLLIRRESLEDQPFALLDMETGSSLPAIAEALDVAAVRWQRGNEAPGGFSSRVRPRGGARAIDAAASDIHGITWAMVRDAPPPETALPNLFAALGDLTVVGHNVEQFDYPILQRMAREAALPAPRHLLLDTLPLARRLLPDAPSHRLGELARTLLGVPGPQPHAATADALLVGHLLDHLLGILRREQELDAMAEALPLVAAGILASGAPLRDENAALLEAGVRARRLGQGGALVQDWLEASPAAAAVLADIDRAGFPASPDDAEWDELAGEWREVAAEYCRTASDRSLPAFLHYAALAEAIDFVPRAALTGNEADPENPDPRHVPLAERVAMMAVHSAKGKEWPIVFVVGAEAGQFPTEWGNDLDEERRILYVAMTRAARRLVLLWVGGRADASPFLREVPAGLLDWR